MKKLYYIVLVFVAVIGFSSCEKLLEVKPENLVGIEEGIQTSSDLKGVLMSTYDVFRNNAVMGGTAKVAADVLAEEAYASSTGFEWGQIKTLNMNLFNPVGRDIWQQSYLTITRANVVIDYIDNNKVPLDPVDAKTWKAEAQFIRAVCYYHLLQYFSLPYDQTQASNSQPGVPIWKDAVLSNEFASTKVQRSSVDDVYQFLISDLEEAELNLPATAPGAGRVSKDGASAFLAKVYFQMNNMTKAFEYSDKIVTAGNYSLDNYWAAKYASASLDSTTHEIIYCIGSTSKNDNSGDGLIGAYRTDKNDPPGFGPNSTLAGQLMEYATDVRNTQLTDKAGANNVPGIYTTKYNYDYMIGLVICYNEILLIRAESGLATSQGSPDDDLHAIQARAGVPLTMASPSNILKERRKELALEGSYFFDLKRTRSNNIHGQPWNSRKLIFQIPDIEQNGNPDIILN
ncbi:MAG: RagB/SusD family nutrient uptake outer membrane protein [Bacteroidales bacterium]